MSYAPSTLLGARDYIIRALGVPSSAVGIVGDSSHDGGYHCGRDRVVSGDYSVVESSRDRNGLTDAAAALDVGGFSRTVDGRSLNLRDFSLWLVAQCKAGAADARDIREVIYSPDGRTVRRWDRLGIRSSGDDSHLWHTHISFFRDSESRDKTALFQRYVNGDDVNLSDSISVSPDWVQVYKSDAGIADGEISVSTALAGGYLHSRQGNERVGALAGKVEALAAQISALTAAFTAFAGQEVTRDQATLDAVKALANGGATAEQIVDALAARLGQ